MSSPRWYYRLVGSEPGSLLHNASRRRYDLIICRENETRGFAIFRDLIEFAKYTFGGDRERRERRRESRRSRTVLPEDRHFYEVIESDTPQKPYFDCECVRKEDGPIDGEFSMTREEGDQAILKLIDCILLVHTEIKREDVVVCSSHGAEKLSYHVIVSRWSVENNFENRAFFKRVMNLYPKELHPLIDAGMYKANQQLRVYGCRKFNSERVKALSPISPWQGGEIVPRLQATLITHVSSCRSIPSTRRVQPKVDFVESNLTSDEVERVLASSTRSPPPVKVTPVVGLEEARQRFIQARERMKTSYNEADSRALTEYTSIYNDYMAKERESKSSSRQVSNTDDFKIRRASNGLVVLDRTSASFCEVCQRVHTSENSFLRVTGPNRDVYRVCWRDTSKKGIFLHSLGPLEASPERVSSSGTPSMGEKTRNVPSRREKIEHVEEGVPTKGELIMLKLKGVRAKVQPKGNLPKMKRSKVKRTWS